MPEGTEPQSGTSAPAGSPSIDTAEYERLKSEAAELRKYREDSEAFYGALEPHRDRIKRLMDDPNAVSIFDDGWNYYEQKRKEAEPKFGEEWDIEKNPTLKKMAEKFEHMEKVLGYVESVEQHQKKDAELRAQEDAYKYTEEVLLKKWPKLAEDNYAGVKEIVEYSVAKQVPFREAAEKFTKYWPSEAADEKPPTRTLRAGGGTVTAPAPKEGEKEISFRDEVLKRLHAAKTRSA